eukprot:gb/GFBE01065913.1/.p1 GENE.gb/GFBE01065913.1/~~gb/GFBE01065913.1/.p1  ORF type:complete len:934 (+),score=200.96 gb/GFBE01065913.1/:1-2802(+)
MTSALDLMDGVGYYGQLNLSRSASHQAICAAYRRRALQTHPDKGGSHDDYIKVREAFEVLSDSQQRADYDAALLASGAQDGLYNSGAGGSAPSAPPSKGHEAPRASQTPSGPLALTAETPWREAARTIVSMMDLPESSWAAVVEQHGIEVLEACRQQLHKSREGPNTRGKAAKEAADGDTSHGRPPLRGLYESKRGHWEVCLSIRRVQFAVFNIADIGKAHDWHVALVELRRTVEEKVRSGLSERDSFREAIADAYETDPELRLLLSFRVNIREGQKSINGPFTHRLETALQLRNRVQQLRDMRAENHDVEREIRDAKAYEKKQRDLQKARQAAMLQEVVAALESLRREAALQARRRQLQPVLALAPPPPDPAAAAPSTPKPTQLDPQTPPRSVRGAAQAEDGGEADAAAEPPQGDGYSVPLKGFVKFCRAMSMTKQQRMQLLRQVQEDQAVQSAISDAIARHAGRLRAAKVSLTDKPRGQEVKASKQLVPALTAGPAATPSQGSSSLAMVVAEPNPKQSWVDRVRDRLRARAENGQPCDKRRKWLLEVLLEKHEAVYYPGLLTMCELMRVAMTSRRVWSASTGATKRQFTNFRLQDFGLVTAKSKRGRALPGGQLRMLKECLRTRRFAVHVQHLDLSTLEMANISKEEFQYMLGCLPNLVSIVLPSKGWAGNLQLKNFVNIAKSLKVSIGAAAEADIILRNVTGGSKPAPARPAPAPLPLPASSTPPSAAADSRFMLQLGSGRKRPRPGRSEEDRDEAYRDNGYHDPGPAKRTKAAQVAEDSETLGFRSSAEELRAAIGRPLHHPRQPAVASQPARRPRAPARASARQMEADPLALPWQAPPPTVYSAPSLGQRPGAAPAGPPVEIPPTPELEALAPTVSALQKLQQGGQLLRRRSGVAGAGAGAEAPAPARQPLASRERHSFWWLPAHGPP